MTRPFSDDELRAAWPGSPNPAQAYGPDCPPPEALLAAIRGEGPEAERLRILDHATACPACRADLALLHATSGMGVSEQAVTPRRYAWRRLAPLALAASVILAVGIAGVGSWINRPPDDVTRGGETGGPGLIAPATGARIGAGLVQFIWHPVAGALRYTMEVSAEDGTVVFTAGTVDTAAAGSLGGASAGPYRWWVRAHLDDGTERRSETRTLEVTR